MHSTRVPVGLITINGIYKALSSPHMLIIIGASLGKPTIL